MIDNVFTETKKEKRINLKAILCVFLALVTVIIPFAYSADISAAETDAKAADNTPVIEIVTGGAKAHLYLKNCIGLTTADFSVKIDEYAVSSLKREFGKDFKKMQTYSSELSNFAMFEVNKKKFSDVRCSLIFADKLCSSRQFDENVKDCGIDGEYFHLATFTMELEDGYTAGDVIISAKGKATFGTKDQKNIRITVNGKEIGAAAHSHKYSSEVTKKANCTNTGVKTFTCVCGDTYTEKIPVNGKHKLSWKIIKNATVSGEGKKEGKCKYCDYKESAVIEKLTEIAVNADKKDKIKLSGENKILSISGTTVTDMLNSITADTAVLTAEGNAAEKEALIATGMKLVMADTDGKALDTKVIIVPGDADCDGNVTAADARKALRCSVGLEELDVYQAAAADIQQDANVGADDARTILRNSVGLDKTEELFKNIV